MSDRLQVAIDVPAELVDAICAEVTLRVLSAQRPPRRWLCGAEAAAEYLGWSPQRVYKRLRFLPHARDGRLLMFDTGALDRYLAEQYEGPARFETSPKIPVRPALGDAPNV
jgi:2-succinyl-5-enolpyruvyl-6-hydroxy-3-cyclohexene-1-carboxylate synthase